MPRLRPFVAAAFFAASTASICISLLACQRPPPAAGAGSSPPGASAAAAPAAATGSAAAVAGDGQAPPGAAPAASASAGSASAGSASAGSTSVGSASVGSASAAGGLLPAAAAVPPPLLVDAAGAPLPQLKDRPSTTSAWFGDLGPALFRAIVADEPELALPHFFPVVAYEQVKAIEKPGRDWETRLVRLFRRDIHEYHRSLGQHRAAMRYEALEVPEERAKLMKPGSEGNRLGYWRVLRAQLVLRDQADRARRLEVTSLISWRGEWYVVHLHGFE